ncbi:MAG TPA: hypothetical protein VGP46_02715, partial [Acidimicrobiales bacterium]|nr:hypothetical protein [Acidimicrobiales bacterium]
SLPGPLLSAAEIAHITHDLLAATDISSGVRLIGVTVSSLEPKETSSGRQLSLLAADDGLPQSRPGSRPEAAGAPPDAATGAAQGEVDLAVDAIRKRYGHAAVGTAAVLGPSGLRVKKIGDSQWGPAPPPPADDDE